VLRGCQRKIVFLKNTGSKLFDQAYFVISDKADRDGICSTDMIAEANRIIEESLCHGEISGKLGIATQIKGVLKRIVLPFLIGAVVSGVSVAIVFIITY
jgi:hypothetical protein